MQVEIFDIFLALVPMGPILVSIDATFSRNQYQGEYPYGGSSAISTFVLGNCTFLKIDTSDVHRLLTTDIKSCKMHQH